MKNNKAKFLATAVALVVSAQTNASIELYNQDGTTFSADGHFNAFYTHTDDEANNEKQSRVRMGFLPNWIGFNVGKEVDGLKLGGRSSFWVSINDSNNSATDTAIDVRQFYGTVDGDFGQVLFGKDFGLYARSNIFSDELLLGTGLPQTSGTGVTFGNISTGYPYATPVSQISYRSPESHGFQIALGIMDPDSGNSTSSGTHNARLEAELTYATDFEAGKFNAWIGAASGENSNGADAQGVAYGARYSTGGLQLTASGFNQEGISATLANTTTGTDIDSDGFLLQASYSFGASRVVASYGETEAGTEVTELNSLAYFYDINSNLKLIAEYDQYEASSGDIDQFAIGAALTW